MIFLPASNPKTVSSVPCAGLATGMELKLPGPKYLSVNRSVLVNRKFPSGTYKLSVTSSAAAIAASLFVTPSPTAPKSSMLFISANLSSNDLSVVVPVAITSESDDNTDLTGSASRICTSFLSLRITLNMPLKNMLGKTPLASAITGLALGVDPAESEKVVAGVLVPVA